MRDYKIDFSRFFNYIYYFNFKIGIFLRIYDLIKEQKLNKKLKTKKKVRKMILMKLNFMILLNLIKSSSNIKQN